MLYAITVSRDITQSCTFTIEADSPDDAEEKFSVLMDNAAVSTRVHTELDECDINTSEVEVVDVWSTKHPDTDGQFWGVNLDTIGKD